MEKTQFQMIGEEVKTVQSWISVKGCVGGDNISENDYICTTDSRGKLIKVRVDKIRVEPGVFITTAEPGREVELLVCGIKAFKIRSGTVFFPPLKGRKKTSTFSLLAQALIAIPIIVYVIYSIILFLLGERKIDSEFLMQVLSLSIFYMTIYGSVYIYNSYLKGKWRKRLKQDYGEEEFRVLKAPDLVYQYLIIPIMVAFIVGVLFATCYMEESRFFHLLYKDSDTLIGFLVFLGMEIFLFATFIYYTWQKIFYSRRLLRVVRFGRKRDIPWSQIHSITLSESNKKGQIIILATTEGKIILKSKILWDGWGDFVDYAIKIATERGIRYDGRYTCISTRQSVSD